MKFRNTVCAAALVAAGVLGAASAASAQEYDRVVVFGDSLSDIGNAYAGSGGASPPSPPYYNGRFSNGPVWVELLGYSGFSTPFNAGPLTDDVVFAFGGARTDTLVPSPPGIAAQLGMYQLGGGTFDADDLVTVWGGANDLFQAMPTAALQPSPTAYMTGIANTAAANLGVTVDTIAGLGAGTVLVPNLPDLGATPQFRTTSGEPLATLSASAFNAALLAEMHTVAANNAASNIIYMDVARAFRAVQADPGRFGFTNVTARCLVGLTVCATPGTYVYWDGVHPTAAGHQLLASVADDYTTYGDRAAATAVQAEAAAFSRRAAFDAAREQLNARQFETGTRTFARFEGSAATLDARGVIPEADVDAAGLRLGVEHGYSPDMTVGVAVGALETNARAGAASFDLNSVSADLFMGWRSGGLFVDAAAGISLDGYDVSRVSALTPAVHQGQTDGKSWGADLRVGWWGEAGGWSLSPRAGLSAVHAEVDGYAEEGAVARHVLADREVDAVSAEASVLLVGDLGERFGASFELGYRDWLSYEGDDVVVSLVDNPAQALARAVEEADGGVVMFDAGVSGSLTENLDLRLGYRGRFGDGFDQHTGGLTVSFRY